MISYIRNNRSSTSMKLFSCVSTRLCHPASLAAVSAAPPGCDSGCQAGSCAEGLQTSRAGAGAGLCLVVHIYTMLCQMHSCILHEQHVDESNLTSFSSDTTGRVPLPKTAVKDIKTVHFL